MPPRQRCCCAPYPRTVTVIHVRDVWLRFRLKLVSLARARWAGKLHEGGSAALTTLPSLALWGSDIGRAACSIYLIAWYCSTWPASTSVSIALSLSSLSLSLSRRDLAARAGVPSAKQRPRCAAPTTTLEVPDAVGAAVNVETYKDGA